MLLGVIAGLGYCLDGETSQCLAHYIMGSAFVSSDRRLSHMGSGPLTAIRRSFGTDWVRLYHAHYATPRLGVPEKEGAEPGISGLLGHYALGTTISKGA
jgi:hypothetical protein